MRFIKRSVGFSCNGWAVLTAVTGSSVSISQASSQSGLRGYFFHSSSNIYISQSKTAFLSGSPTDFSSISEPQNPCIYVVRNRQLAHLQASKLRKCRSGAGREKRPVITRLSNSGFPRPLRPLLQLPRPDLGFSSGFPPSS